MLFSTIASVMLAAIIPQCEMDICREVAKEYGLCNEQAELLVAIRVHEAGLAGLEFGIGGPMNNGHPAHRFALGQKDRTVFNAASFRCQAQWAAGTIRNRYRGDLLAFARVYCPRGAWAWFRNVSSILWRIRNGKEGK